MKIERAFEFKNEYLLPYYLFSDGRGKHRIAIDLNLIPYYGTANAAVTPYATVSLGVATCIPSPHQHTNTLLQAADRALYESKRQGRDRITQVDLDRVTEDLGLKPRSPGTASPQEIEQASSVHLT